MEDWRIDKSWLKDSRDKIVLLGLIIPILLIAWGIFNVVVGRAYWPSRGYGDVASGLLFRFTDPWRVLGLTMCKWAMGGGYFCWYALANFNRTENMALPGLLIFIVLLVTGIVIFMVGFFG